jgi:hypothetical protein
MGEEREPTHVAFILVEYVGGRQEIQELARGTLEELRAGPLPEVISYSPGMVKAETLIDSIANFEAQVIPI